MSQRFEEFVDELDALTKKYLTGVEGEGLNMTEYIGAMTVMANYVMMQEYVDLQLEIGR